MGVPTRVFFSEATRRSAWKDPNDPPVRVLPHTRNLTEGVGLWG